MNIYTLSWKNLLRNRWRSLLTMLSIAVSAATLFAILSFHRGFSQAMKEEMDSTGVHLFLSTEGCPSVAATLLIQGGEIPRYLSVDALERTQKVPGVKNAGGYLIYTAISPAGKYDLFFGVTDEIKELKPHWKLKGHWFQSEDEVILGSRVADDFNAKVGKEIHIESLKHKFTVAGILEESRGQDDTFVFMPLNTAQQIFKKENKLTAIGIQLEDVGKFLDVKNELEKIPSAYVVQAEQMSDEILNMVGGTKVLMTVVVIVALLISAISLMNTVLMAAIERRQEFACFRCLGAAPEDIFQLIIWESLLLAVVGSALGVFSGWLLAGQLDYWLRDFLPYTPASSILRPDIIVITGTLMIVIAIGIASALFPAVKAAKIPPMEAMRNG